MDTPESNSGTEVVPYMPWHFTQAERATLSAPSMPDVVKRVIARRKIGTYEAELETAAMKKVVTHMEVAVKATNLAVALEEQEGRLMDVARLEEELGAERARRMDAERDNRDLQVIIAGLRNDVARVTAANAMAVSS